MIVRVRGIPTLAQMYTLVGWSGWAMDLRSDASIFVEADGSEACSLGSSVWQGGGCQRRCGFESYSDMLQFSLAFCLILSCVLLGRSAKTSS
ncbi:hypothetical protein PoB_000778200 [Plakobranchus ocellatus]|uniref:Uncharacterized protein n=1 Tax=Plakobranchus ocellatus TaxID=259542 RepID=A0AAV3YGC8_9GAST|nr:hypothetical protein PoB_000778200 [Plakobranchus ocellatus]